MELVGLLFVFLMGLVIGSFLNVIIYRVPRGESLMGRSHCPGCNTQIAAFDNVPVFSWLVLRAKCRHCKTRISFQYPAVELLTAVLFGLVYWTFGWTFLTVMLLIFAAVSVSLFMIDAQTLRLPDIIVGPSTVIIVIPLTIYTLTTNNLDPLISGVGGAAILGLTYFALWFLTMGRGLGFGDVKLAPLLGFLMGYFGWGALAVGTASAWLLGAVVGVTSILLGKAKRGKPIPFGPFLLVGAWIGIFVGNEVFQSYWNFMQEL